MSNEHINSSGEVTVAQYSKKKIFFLWALVALPMLLLKFVALPVLMGVVDIHPGILYWWLMIIGMIWQFFLSLIILRKELGKLSWEKLKNRLWLNPPKNPKNGNTFRKAYLLTIPIIIYAAIVEQLGIFSFIEEGVLQLLPFMADPVYTHIESLMAPEFQDAWYLLGIAVISSIFNYLLGEELFFRGILLPKMEGAFGQWDWVINGILFSTYHLHKFAEIPIFIFGSIFYSLLNKRYKSFYPGLIIHGVEAIPLFLFILLFVSGVI